ncbi:MAG TPA: mechanosensitive ion channel domain-containing protein [Actinomycetaceae bacterium]|nr:mechanosensitive ion channel domain-containing protein [Actinomycetaceae bacterium]
MLVLQLQDDLPLQDGVGVAAEAAVDFLAVIAAGLIGLVIGAIVSIVLSVMGVALRRRHPGFAPFSRRLRMPQRVLLLILGAGFGVLFATQESVVGEEVPWRPVFVQAFWIVLLLALAYLLTSLMFAIEDAVLAKFEGSEETGYARRVTTQMQMIRRIVIAIIWTSAVVGGLMTFPSFRGVGTTFFASAGVASLIAGLALQGVLGNVFAGIQIAFSDSIRVGDAVIVQGEYGSIEELTLTYVVVRLWDNRRIIVPSVDFSTKPFENWTRRDPELLGTVFMDLDWLTPVPALRVELQRLVESTDLWNGNTCTLQVFDAVDGKVRTRAVVSADSPGELWDLRCLVREGLVEWTQRNARYSVPRLRIEPESAAAPSPEEREEFIGDVEREWAETRPVEEEDEEFVDDVVVDATTDDPVLGWLMGRDDARRVRKDAERADKRAAREDPARLGAQDRVLPRPSSEGTELIDPEEFRRREDGEDGDERDERGGKRDEHGPHRTSIIPTPPVIKPGAERQLTAESRLFSGSPAAEERARLLKGPGAEEMAQREATTIRRLRGSQPLADPSGDESADGEEKTK